MKAQSELAGDSKRPAEMAGPRFDGVTRRMASMAKLAEMEGCVASVFESIPDISIAQELAEATQNAVSMNPTVNHRPAGQQWPVCTP